jgi:hypothetical protein
MVPKGASQMQTPRSHSPTSPAWQYALPSSMKGAWPSPPPEMYQGVRQDRGDALQHTLLAGCGGQRLLGRRQRRENFCQLDKEHERGFWRNDAAIARFPVRQLCCDRRQR